MACQMVAAVAAVGRSGLLEARVVDFCVSAAREACDLGLSSCRVKKIIRRACARQSAPCSKHELYMYLQYMHRAQKGLGGGMGVQKATCCSAAGSTGGMQQPSQHACIPAPRRRPTREAKRRRGPQSVPAMPPHSSASAAAAAAARTAAAKAALLLLLLLLPLLLLLLPSMQLLPSMPSPKRMSSPAPCGGLPRRKD